MARLSSVFRSANVIRKERALTNDELMRCVPSVFSGEKHESRSDRYTYIRPFSMPFCSSCCAMVMSASSCCGTRSWGETCFLVRPTEEYGAYHIMKTACVRAGKLQ
ncbi:hypothetical protein FNH64_19670 [Salmonella enterica subsp. diarizonae]|nr:hypothetical protein [Salmonella enterica subsp. diarizonae]